MFVATLVSPPTLKLHELPFVTHPDVTIVDLSYKNPHLSHTCVNNLPASRFWLAASVPKGS